MQTNKSVIKYFLGEREKCMKEKPTKTNFLNLFLDCLSLCGIRFTLCELNILSHVSVYADILSFLFSQFRTHAHKLHSELCL